MKETPILFSAPMVRAILDGRKTQTRRVVKGVPAAFLTGDVAAITNGNLWAFSRQPGCHVYPPNIEPGLHCPYGQSGDRLWVRETHWLAPPITPRMLRRGADTWPRVAYDADCSEADRDDWRAFKWKRKPSIFMRPIHCRIRLEVVKVRVERLQDISGRDALAEGIEDTSLGFSPGKEDIFRSNFKQLWDSLNAKRGFGWKENPWVWVVEFRLQVARVGKGETGPLMPGGHP